MLDHLSPRGHGTPMELPDFAERCASQAPYGSPVALPPHVAPDAAPDFQCRRDRALR
ncbi:hypothetical protein [Streptomyces sp. NPDC020597]|uniref:hypothetical protein n=1 Tax=unclassified Streptomyces TaxID=2593676 RepID=UPI0037934BCA